MQPGSLELGAYLPLCAASANALARYKEASRPVHFSGRSVRPAEADWPFAGSVYLMVEVCAVRGRAKGPL